MRTRPVPAYKSHGGGIEFIAKKGFQDLPIDLPCGHCPHCRMAKARDWAIRCSHEAAMHDANSFITLTYDQEHLPANRGLQKSDWQDFAKRVRKTGRTFRYFHCGEYGDLRHRPHYHALLFGLDFSDDRKPHSSRGKYKTWRSKSLEELWPWGLSEIGTMSYKSASYVARYAHKKQALKNCLETYRRTDKCGNEWFVEPEYTSMSLKPGLGNSWFQKNYLEVYQNDYVVLNGKKMKPPKYYDDLLEARNPHLHRLVMLDRLRFIKNSPSETDRERYEREQVLRSKNALFPRETQ